MHFHAVAVFTLVWRCLNLRKVFILAQISKHYQPNLKNKLLRRMIWRLFLEIWTKVEIFLRLSYLYDFIQIHTWTLLYCRLKCPFCMKWQASRRFALGTKWCSFSQGVSRKKKLEESDLAPFSFEIWTSVKMFLRLSYLYDFIQIHTWTLCAAVLLPQVSILYEMTSLKKVCTWYKKVLVFSGRVPKKN